MYASGRRLCTTRCRCLPEDTDIINRMRNSLRQRYYSVPREVTLEEVNIILTPLFQDISLDVNVINRRAHIIVTNKPPPKHEFDTNIAVLDIINEWGMHDRFRRFLTKSLTNANKHNLYRYQPGVQWKCPMDVYYVFNPMDITDLTI